jgi:hypothetical protein
VGDRSCKRCSVSRVNILCEVYIKAHQKEDSKAMQDLRKVADLVNARGFDEANKILTPGLANQHLRAFCWNFSSFLEDEDMKQIFGWVSSRGKE